MTAAVDKTYLTHLARGGELLRADKVDDARAELERARELKPGDGRIMNLLGLTYFRLARYDDAQLIYAELIKRSPQDAALRLNLGLVHLKRGDVDDAIRELTRARELEPSQLRTMGYLGLAFARKGRYALARDAFLAAGQEELAKEMDQQLAIEMARPQAQAANGAAAAAAAVAASEAPSSGPRRRPTSHGLRAVDASAIPVAIAAPASAPVPVPIPVPNAPSAPVAVVTAPGRPASTSQPAPPVVDESLEAFTRKRLIRPEARDVPFEVAAGQALIIRVRGKVYARTEGVLVSAGELIHTPARKRVRGRITDEPFATVHLLSGQGHVVALPRGGVFATVQLDDDVLYVREELVFAFEERLSWENGSVPGSNGTLAIVQLRGSGALALRSTRPLMAIEVAGDRSLRVAAEALAGWTGGVMPTFTGKEIEHKGEGTVLVEEPNP